MEEENGLQEQEQVDAPVQDEVAQHLAQMDQGKFVGFL